MTNKYKTPILGALMLGLAAFAIPARVADANADIDKAAQATYDDVQATMGGVPDFVKMFPKAGIAGAWAEVRGLELSDQTALSPKEKALISLAVSATDSLPVLHLVRHQGRPGRRRHRRGDRRGGRGVGSHPALEHDIQRPADRHGHLQEGNGRRIAGRDPACAAPLRPPRSA